MSRRYIDTVPDDGARTTEERAAFDELTRLCADVGECRQQMLDQLGAATAAQIGRLLSSCGVDAGTLLAAAAETNAGWPPEVLGALVAGARAKGASWDEIGRHFRVSRQAAHQRFAPYDTRYRDLITELLSGAGDPTARDRVVSDLLAAIGSAGRSERPAGVPD
jgi:hypothetical protein